MFLVVKGSLEQAQKAAKQRGLGQVFLRNYTGYGDVVVSASALDSEKVVQWFREDGSAPYPAGSLLAYWG